MDHHVRVRWTSHQGTVLSMLDLLQSTDSMVDCTLACDGHFIRVHRVVLSACSPYFQELFEIQGNEKSIVFLKDVRYGDMKAIVEYMYRGESSVSQDDLPSFLAVAKALRVRGLGDVTSCSDETQNQPVSSTNAFANEMPPLNPVASVATPIPSSPSVIETLSPVPTRKKPRNDYIQKTPLRPHPQAKSFQQRSLVHPEKQNSPASIPYSTSALSSGPCSDKSSLQHQSTNQVDFLQREQPTQFQPDQALKLEVQEGLVPEVVDLEDEDVLPNCDEGKWNDPETGIPISSVNSSAIGTKTNTRPNEVASGAESGVHDFAHDRMEGLGDGMYTEDFGTSRGRRSGVWQHFFTCTSDDGEPYSQCNYCDKRYKRSTSTTNMKSHLNISHQIFF